ncbi:MAG: hypothetical protein J0H01_26830 [Rhizobiales bacterium]|nr:hypothetical protein [Hyphomicrobiales bacterium]
MGPPANTFLLPTILVLGTILIIFGMKFIAAARSDRLRLAGESGYRALAEKAAVAQVANAASLTTLQADLADMKGRLAAIEKLLRDV